MSTLSSLPKRLNLTYMMLDKAEKFQRAFERLEDEDLIFKLTMKEGVDEDEDDEGNSGRVRRGKKILGALNGDDWDKIRLFVRFLELLNEATLRVSWSRIVTANAFAPELMIRDTIEEQCTNENVALQRMAMGMKENFEKYWENLDNMNLLLYVTLILDPRYKM